MSTPQPKKVALFVTRYLDYSQTFVHEELKNHRRYQAEVFCARRKNHESFPFEPVHEAGRLYEATRRSPRFDRRLGVGDFALLHAHFGTGAVYAAPFARRHKLPFVVSFHGREVPLLGSAARLYPKNWPYAALSRDVLSSMDLGLCASTELYELLLEQGVPEHKLAVHRLGVDVERFVPAARTAGPAEVLMIGRFVEKKGMVHGLRAFARATRGGRARLTLVGDGPLRPTLEQLAHDLGVTRRVDFAGVCSPDDVRRRLSTADVLLAPSCVSADGDRESGILVVKEASASGAVPVATWHGGIPSIVDDGVTGFLVPERDVARLASRLRMLLDDASLRASMGAAARAKMLREFDNRSRVAALEQRYDALLEHTRGWSEVA